MTKIHLIDVPEITLVDVCIRRIPFPIHESQMCEGQLYVHVVTLPSYAQAWVNDFINHERKNQ